MIKVRGPHCLKVISAGLVLLAWALAIPQTGFSAGPATVLTLRQSVQMAIDYSPTLAAAREDLLTARYGEKEAFTNYLPSFSTSYNWQINDYPPSRLKFGGNVVEASSEHTYQWSTSVTQPIFTGFRISSTYKLAELGVSLAQIQLDLAVLDVILSVNESYILYLQAQKSLEVAHQSVLLLKSQLKTSQDFYDVGIIPINDVLKVKVELANAQQAEVTAENSVSVNRARLNSLLGLPVDQSLEVEDILRYRPVDLTYPKARNVARVERPELKAAEIRIKQGDESIKKAQSGYYPEVRVQGSYIATSDAPELGDSYYYDPSQWEVLTTLNWTFWEWGRTKHQVSGQKAQKRRFEALRRDLEDQVDLQVKQAYLFLQESEKNIATAKTSITQAEENYRITMERYKEQLTTNTEVLDAQTLLTKARNNYFTALTTYFLAGARLLRAMGRGLPEEQAKNKVKP